MKLCPRGKILLFALVFCFVISSVFAETMITESSDHDCKEPNCLVCLKIETARNQKLTGITLFSVNDFTSSAPIPKNHTDPDYYPPSLVVLKIRFNS